MSKNLPTIKQDTSLALKRAKSLISITNKILAKKDKVPKETTKPIISDDQNRVIEYEDGILAWVDKETGLMWEVKTKESVKHNYVWSKEYIENAHAPEKWTDTVKDAFSYANKLNRQLYAGFDDWRIPSGEELRTLINKTRLNSLCIKQSLSKTSSSGYWSSTTVAGDTSFAWVVYFDSGYGNWHTRTGDGYVRCVR